MPHQTLAGSSITEPTNKSVTQKARVAKLQKGLDAHYAEVKARSKNRAKVRTLTDALESGRAEAKPGAKPDFSGVSILEAQRAGRAFQKSLRASAPRRAAAKAKGRAYKARTATRTGGR